MSAPFNNAPNDPPEPLARPHVAAMDALLGRPLPVLDQGFVRVIDYMGSDESIVQAARVSYGLGTKKVHEDRGLIRYLLRHAHTTPFEMCELKLHVRVPMDCWRQWIRHRTANVNEYSTRYSVAIDAFQKTLPTEWRLQSSSNRQGSSANVAEEEGLHLSREEDVFHETARALYARRLGVGVAREQARKDLPLSTYTEAYWKVDLHNLFHFLRLRMDGHAQSEIRAYAATIGNEIVSKWCPVAWEAFSDYQLGALTLTRIDREVIRYLIAGDSSAATAAASNAGWISRSPDGVLTPNRERAEFEAKIETFGVKAPWQD